MAHRAVLEVEPEWAEEESGWRSAEEILMAGRLVNRAALKELSKVV